MVIRGRVQNGVVVFEEGVTLAEGTEVTVVVEGLRGPQGEVMSAEAQRRLRAAMDRLAAVPDENPGDTFSGADHDEVLYGDR
jgi:hypothetical protein